jgi:hypothetical protein
MPAIAATGTRCYGGAPLPKVTPRTVLVDGSCPEGDGAGERTAVVAVVADGAGEDDADGWADGVG